MAKRNEPAANKELGQHYLSNLGIVCKIVDEVSRLARDNNKIPIVEIGPGPGALTSELLKRGFSVHAIEVDTRMVDHLRAEFKSEVEKKQFHIVHKNALNLKSGDLPLEPFIVCGNLPYNVGSQIVFLFIEQIPQARDFCFMLQKEVVQKFLGPVAKESWSTPSIKLANLCTHHSHFWVKPGSFSPPPKVDSGVFSFSRKDKEKILVSPFEDTTGYETFSRFLHKAFSQKRKMLRGLFPALKTQALGARRAEELGPEEIFALSRKLAETE